MRLGRVKIPHNYVVDLDDEKMVEEAMNCLYEDLMNSVKYNELYSWIRVEIDPTANIGDIPDFIKCEDEEDEELE